jgi:hypothetical protein
MPAALVIGSQYRCQTTRLDTGAAQQSWLEAVPAQLGKTLSVCAQAELTEALPPSLPTVTLTDLGAGALGARTGCAPRVTCGLGARGRGIAAGGLVPFLLC